MSGMRDEQKRNCLPEMRDQKCRRFLPEMQRAVDAGGEEGVGEDAKDPQFLKAAELAVQAAELLARIEAEEQEVPESEIKEIELPEDVLRLKELLGKTTLRRFDKPSDRSDQKRETGSVADPVEAPALRQAQGLRASTTGEPCRTTCSAANKMKSKAELRAEYSKSRRN